MFDKAIQFLKDHKEVAFATSEGDLPKLRIFQIMKQEGHMLYFATSEEKAVYKELRQNPNVEILAYADNISVRCSGMVNEHKATIQRLIEVAPAGRLAVVGRLVIITTEGSNFPLTI